MDLPGRGATVEELHRITLADWVASAADQAAALEVEEVVVVGHSLGGATIPGLAAALGERTRALVFVAALAPAEGATVAQLLNPQDPSAVFDGNGLFPVPPPELTTVFLGLTELEPEEREAWLSRLVPEPPGPFTAPTNRSAMPDVPIVYVQGEKDVPVPAELADVIVGNLGRPVERIVLPAGHSSIRTHAPELGRIVERLAGVTG